MGRTCVLAVRHAPTESTGLCVGSGEVACAISAEEAAEKIRRSMAGRTFTHVWASPIERCKAPASFLADKLSLPLCIDHRLKEVCLGRWQLRSWAAIEASEPARYRSWLKNWLTQAPPGGESVTAFLGRVDAWWKQLPSGEHLLVSHAGVNRALRVLVHGKRWTEAMAISVPHLHGELFERAADSAQTALPASS